MYQLLVFFGISRENLFNPWLRIAHTIDCIPPMKSKKKMKKEIYVTNCTTNSQKKSSTIF